MLLTELLTDKRGPLAKIWMSAHQEKKLSKRDAMGIDIEESVGMSLFGIRIGQIAKCQ
jgi:cohesin complex subunit SCC1